MVKIKKIIKGLIPPLIISFFRRNKESITLQEIWSGDYSSWDEVKSKCDGYDSELILETCKQALLKVKNGEAVYERDSVLFDTISYSWGLLAGLERVALENEGKLCVLDFGGSLGSSYYQNREFLHPIKQLQWCVIEQGHFVTCGKEHFEDDQLRFFKTIDDCLQEYRPQVILLSGVLQYLEDPQQWFSQILEYNISYIIIDRTSFIYRNWNLLTLQSVPSEIYRASYPCWFFSEADFLKLFDSHYQLLGSFDSFADTNMINRDGNSLYWKGFILKLKK